MSVCLQFNATFSNGFVIPIFCKPGQLGEDEKLMNIVCVWKIKTNGVPKNK